MSVTAVSLVALLLAALGVYGFISFDTSRSAACSTAWRRSIR
jgi:hypothetical protein